MPHATGGLHPFEAARHDLAGLVGRVFVDHSTADRERQSRNPGVGMNPEEAVARRRHAIVQKDERLDQLADVRRAHQAIHRALALALHVSHDAARGGLRVSGKLGRCRGLRCVHGRFSFNLAVRLPGPGNALGPRSRTWSVPACYFVCERNLIGRIRTQVGMSYPVTERLGNFGCPRKGTRETFLWDLLVGKLMPLSI